MSWIRIKKKKKRSRTRKSEEAGETAFSEAHLPGEPHVYGIKWKTGWNAGEKGRWSHRAKGTEDKRSMVQMPEETLLSRNCHVQWCRLVTAQGDACRVPCCGITPTVVISGRRQNPSQGSSFCGRGGPALRSHCSLLEWFPAGYSAFSSALLT